MLRKRLRRALTRLVISTGVSMGGLRLRSRWQASLRTSGFWSVLSALGMAITPSSVRSRRTSTMALRMHHWWKKSGGLRSLLRRWMGLRRLRNVRLLRTSSSYSRHWTELRFLLFRCTTSMRMRMTASTDSELFWAGITCISKKFRNTHHSSFSLTIILIIFSNVLNNIHRGSYAGVMAAWAISTQRMCW